ncbi:type II toxin-antitoxin system HicB family antitoxin [Massilia sp. TS11]|uniref:type II toxin-antitoxin system HicB family antitoxin n=1 Tax=Massilia sp. TS11 TaxID=2908003 RepID=UPI001EDC4E5A|nr:type II toxin-antitoxin system HicB family antitoxin [Massilia sp. TS11]MCG2586483.1 type II toxin-antitoxin system HicB family antitoxin [Massilia sp. TS11]
MQYPVTLTEDPGHGLIVTFRDIPEAISQGDDVEEALAMAEDALLTALEFYFEDMRKVPAPSEQLEGEHLVRIPASVAVKVLLLNEMVEQNFSVGSMVHLLGLTRLEANRLLDPDGSTDIDTIERALKLLGRSLEFSLK